MEFDKVARSYDLGLDQFMDFDTTVTIFDIATPVESFYDRLSFYNDKYSRHRSIYALEDINYKTFKFNDMSFIEGFVTPFSWVNEDHHKYWTKLIKISSQHPQGEKIMF